MNKAKTQSAIVREQLSHPVIDSDGHTIEFEPAVMEVLKEVAGARVVERYRTERFNGMANNLGGLARARGMSDEERRDKRAATFTWWTRPTKNTLDHATSVLPKLLHERLGEFGIDVSVLFPTVGLIVPHLDDEEIRRSACRAINTYHSRIFRNFGDRLIPIAVIPMHTPEEAIAELEHAVGVLGMRAVMLAGFVMRPVPFVARAMPEASAYSYWIDNLCLESAHDYDPVWQKCIDLKVSPTFHSVGMGWGSRTSLHNYMYNHIGHFAAAHEALCKAMFFGGVTRRFPNFRCAFMEGGTAWGASLYADIIARWNKRNPVAIENYNPANLDVKLMEELCLRYGPKEITERMQDLRHATGIAPIGGHPPTNEFLATGTSKAENIRELFVPHFYFGCEADDPMNAIAFNSKMNPFGARLRAIFGSDIGHWDVPDMTEVTEEAFELVEHGLITEQDFRDFVFANPASFWTSANPDFFKGTAVEHQVSKFVTGS